MPVPIPDSTQGNRYRRRGSDGNVVDISAADAIRAFADDYLQSGDPRLALERAFRWGYRNARGEHVAGLQEHLQELRHRRDRLRRSVEHDAFLDSLVPEFDRIDVIDRETCGEQVGPEDADTTTIERLMNRMEQGYRSDEARQELDRLLGSLRAAATEGADREPRTESRGAGQQASPFGAMRSARMARADQLRRMLFEGGIEGERGAEPSGWRRRAMAALDPLAAADMQLLAELDRVEQALDHLEMNGSVLSVDALGLSELDIPADTCEWLAGWQRAIDAVTEVDASARGGRRLAIPPAIIAAIGRDLLRGLFRAASSPIVGQHEANQPGTSGDAAEATVPWEPGHPLDLNLVATLMNAARRGGVPGDGTLSFHPDDFAVQERGARTSVSTIIAIDRSRSMGQSGSWAAAKRVALAMHELIAQSYPRDTLRLIGFSSVAQPIDIAGLAEMQWDRFEHGTHFQAALELGRSMHRRSRAGTRQIVVVTDGEPTLARIGGEDVFASSPSPQVLAATMTEVIRCTREGVTINIVMLGARGRNAFAEQVARVNRGRVFQATNESLGSYLIRDYTTH